MRAMLQSAGLGALRSADLDLVPGRYVVLSNEPGTLQAFAALLSGREAPRHGSVMLDGQAPASSPPLRRRIACLFEDESLPPARTTLGAVERALSLRGESESRARELLAQTKLEHLAELSPSALAERDLRAVALALALAHDRADLFVLHEPLTTSLPRSTLLDGLERHALRGATIVLTTTSSADATTLGGEWLCIELGRVRASASPRLGAGPWQRVVVTCSDAAGLARALHDSQLALAIDPGVEPGSLNVTGAALDVTVAEILRVARAHGIELARVQPLAPPVEALLAARAGFARGAYEAARVAALGTPMQAPMPVATSPAPPPELPPGGLT